MPSRRFLFYPVLVLAVLLAVPSAARGVDNSLYAELLARHVRAGVVDYAGLMADKASLEGYLAVLEAVQPETLPREERFAFWINVYNAFTLHLVLQHLPGIESIKDIGGLCSSPWGIGVIHVGGRTLTLDEVEKAILIPEFLDARVHFAINCASKSCPPLLAEPYEGARLEQQLEERAMSFINDPAHNGLEGDTLRLSRIFKWYKNDFGGDPVAYVQRFARGELAQGLSTLGGGVRVRYRDYDWSLNGR